MRPPPELMGRSCGGESRRRRGGKKGGGVWIIIA